MQIVVYQHTEPPVVLEHVTCIREDLEGDVIVIEDEVDGRLEFRADDIMKLESR